MSVGTLKKVRDAIVANAPLMALFTARYDKPVAHLIGYKKNPDVSELPSFCYVPLRQNYVVLPPMVNGIASIVIGILEDGISDDVFDGVAQAEAFANQIRRFLSDTANPPLSDVILEDFIINTDSGLTHPFYQTEISFKYRERDK